MSLEAGRLGLTRLGVPVPGGCPSGGHPSRKPDLTLQSLTRHWITSFRWLRLRRFCQRGRKTQAEISSAAGVPAKRGAKWREREDRDGELDREIGKRERDPERRRRAVAEEGHDLVRP